MTKMIQPTHFQFLVAAANLHAFNFGLQGETDPAVFRKVVQSVVVPEFTPKSGVTIQVNDSDPVAPAAGGGACVLSFTAEQN